jgi:hypothetical protein
MPDYEIIEWNEDNYDVNKIPYTAEAYAAKKYAFVSDYARFDILYQYGGLYFDTDVEVIKPFDDIVANGPFMGIEKSCATKKHNPHGWVGINPGLGIGSDKGNFIYRDILNHYNNLVFSMNIGTVVKHTTDILKKYGYDGTNSLQNVGGITIYPDEYFCPMDSTTGLLDINSKTVSIHHYTCSWIDRNSLSFKLHLLKNSLIRVFGAKLIMGICRILKK